MFRFSNVEIVVGVVFFVALVCLIGLCAGVSDMRAFIYSECDFVIAKILQNRLKHTHNTQCALDAMQVKSSEMKWNFVECDSLCYQIEPIVFVFGFSANIKMTLAMTTATTTTPEEN